MVKGRVRDSRAGRRELRRLAGLAHERELTRALRKLGEGFQLWSEGRLDPHELNELVHDYHQGEQREMWGRYKRGNEIPTVVRALAVDLLQPEELSPALFEELEPAVEFFRSE